MTGRRRTQLVGERAAVILASEPGLQAYVAHFEAELRRGKIRRLLSIGYMHFTRAEMVQAGLDPRDI